MRRHSLCNSVSAAVIGASLLGLAGAASAQDAGDQATSVDDIIVTAQKREQSLQEVPIVVTTLSEALLEGAGVLAPGVGLFAGAGASSFLLHALSETASTDAIIKVLLIIFGLL